MNEQDKNNHPDPMTEEEKDPRYKDYPHVYVNGRLKIWAQETISYEQAVVLAFGYMENPIIRTYTITYHRGDKEKPDGSMLPNNIIKVKEYMIFNISSTDKS